MTDTDLHGNPVTPQRRPYGLTIEVRVRDLYGVRRYYPTNETAKTLARIAGTQTLTPETLRLAADGLGARILETHDEGTWR